MSILLRTLTLKSILKDLPGGFLENQVVQTVLNANANLLVKIYYKFEKITFSDDILNTIGIPDHLRIAKPGTNTTFYMEWLIWKDKNMNDQEKNSRARHFKAVKKRKLKVAVILGDRYSKRKAQLKNHGKFIK